MKTGLIISITFLMFGNLYAQNTPKEKIETVKDKVLQFINSKKADSLYNLAGDDFKKQLPFDAFETWCYDNIFPLGKIAHADLKKLTNGIAKYKVVFKKDVAAMLIGVDAKGKFNAFGFQPWEDDGISIVKSDNTLTTKIDRQVETIVQSFMQKSKTVGLSIGILKDGKTYFYNYGETKKSNGQIPSSKNLYEIGSITKTFTGILLAKAVLENKINLTDPVNKYLPKNISVIKSGNDTLRIVHLSNHTSGLPSLPDNFDFTNLVNPYVNYDNTKLYAYLKKVKLAQKPGQNYEYSNLAVGLLGNILETVNKMSYEKMINTFITSQAGMANTRQFLLKRDTALFMQGYSETLLPNSQWDFKAMAAAGCLRSNTEDMLKYAQINIDAKNTALEKAIAQAQIPTFEKGNNIVALNWHIVNNALGKLIWHNGGTGGFRSILLINSKTKNAVIVLSNTAVNNDAMGIEILKSIDN